MTDERTKNPMLSLAGARRYLAVFVVICLPLSLSSLAFGGNNDTIEKLIERESTLAREYETALLAREQESSAETEARVASASKSYKRIKLELDHARASALGEFSGRDATELLQQRNRGALWRDIAREIDVHPSIIGIELIDTSPPPFVTVAPPE